MKVNTSWAGVPLDPLAIASPCGSIGITLLIQHTLSSMTPFSCSLRRIELKLMRLGFLGLTIRVKNSKELLIVRELNG
jgi:hypothetical protein